VFILLRFDLRGNSKRFWTTQYPVVVRVIIIQASIDKTKNCEKIPEIEFCLKISYTEIIMGLIIGCNFTAAQSLE